MNKQIDEIMDWFDFDRVHKCMVLMDWTWATISDVPDLGTLRSTARKYLREVADHPGWSTGSGGFVATNTDGRLSLRFEVASWEWYEHS